MKVYWYYSENLENFKRFHIRNFVPSSLLNTYWARGTAEALKSLLADILIEDCILAFFNKYNKFLRDMNKNNNSNDNNNINCNIYNEIVINNYTKGDIKIHVPNRIFISAPHIECSNLDESKTVDY